eukprot:7088863-Prymnesium_polylepis.1
MSTPTASLTSRSNSRASATSWLPPAAASSVAVAGGKALALRKPPQRSERAEERVNIRHEPLSVLRVYRDDVGFVDEGQVRQPTAIAKLNNVVGYDQRVVVEHVAGQVQVRHDGGRRGRVKLTHALDIAHEPGPVTEDLEIAMVQAPDAVVCLSKKLGRRGTVEAGEEVTAADHIRTRVDENRIRQRAQPVELGTAPPDATEALPRRSLVVVARALRAPLVDRERRAAYLPRSDEIHGELRRRRADKQQKHPSAHHLAAAHGRHT